MDWPRAKPMKEWPRRDDMERGVGLGYGGAGGKQDRPSVRVAGLGRHAWLELGQTPAAYAYSCRHAPASDPQPCGCVGLRLGGFRRRHDGRQGTRVERRPGREYPHRRRVRGRSRLRCRQACGAWAQRRLRRQTRPTGKIPLVQGRRRSADRSRLCGGDGRLGQRLCDRSFPRRFCLVRRPGRPGARRL